MLNDNVLLEEVKKENVTDSGIILTKPEDERIKKYIVKGYGDSVKDLEPGQTVLVDKYNVKKMGDYLITKNDLVLAIVEE